MDQHNFEMIHFKCTIPAIGCTIPVLLCYADSWFALEFEVPASKRRLRWKKQSQFIQPQHFTKFTSIFHFVWDILLVSFLFLGGSYSFKLYAIHQQFWKHLKVQKFTDQHNFEMIHLKCTIPIGCIIHVLLCYTVELAPSSLCCTAAPDGRFFQNVTSRSSRRMETRLGMRGKALGCNLDFLEN